MTVGFVSNYNSHNYLYRQHDNCATSPGATVGNCVQLCTTVPVTDRPISIITDIVDCRPTGHWTLFVDLGNSSPLLQLWYVICISTVYLEYSYGPTSTYLRLPYEYE